jgi:hypothetical protein
MNPPACLPARLASCIGSCILCSVFPESTTVDFCTCAKPCDPCELWLAYLRQILRLCRTEQDAKIARRRICLGWRRADMFPLVGGMIGLVPCFNVEDYALASVPLSGLSRLSQGHHQKSVQKHDRLLADLLAGLPSDGISRRPCASDGNPTTSVLW